MTRVARALLATLLLMAIWVAILFLSGCAHPERRTHTIPGKTYESPAGWHCVVPDSVIVCTPPTPVTGP